MTNSGNRPEEFNPALLPHPECNAAKYWELLRRNKKFQKISEMFSKNTHEIKKHHINNNSVACCLYWMLSENYLNPEDNDAHNSEVKFWRPDLYKAKIKYDPIAIEQSWPDTNEEFRKTLIRILAGKQMPEKLDLSLKSYQNLDGETALTRAIHLNKFNSDFFVVGIPRGSFKEKELKNHLDCVRKLYRLEHPLPDDTRKPSFLGTSEQWDAFLLVENETSIKAACIEREVRNAKKEGRKTDALSAEKKNKSTIIEHKNVIEALIDSVFSTEEISTFIQYQSSNL